MAPEVAEVVWYSEDSASPITVSKPALFTSGDILLAVIWQHNNPSNQSELTTSADWVLEGNCDGVLTDAKIFSHVYDPADPSTWSFAYRSTADVCLGLFRITGADQAPVVTVTSTASASVAASMDSPSLNPGGSDDLLIVILGNHGNGAAASSVNPTSTTDLAQVQVSNLYMSMTAAHQALVSSAPTGVRTWTSVSPTGNSGGTISIAVKSPASSDPLDPIVNVGPPPWIARQIAMQQTLNRFQENAPPPPGAENATLVAGLSASGSAVRVASCSGRASLGLSTASTETRTDVYVAEYFSSFQSDGLGNGSAITTARTYTGDRLIVAVTDSQSSTPPTAPGGWSEITLPDTDQGTNFEVHVYQLLNPAALTTYTWTITGGRRTIVGALVRGASTTTLLDEADSLETATSTTHASPSVVTLGPNRAILAFNVLRGFPTSAWSQASGWLEYVETVGGDATTNMQVSLQARTAPTATTYSDTFTCAVAEPAIIVLLAVIPAIGGSGAAETGNAQLALTTKGSAVKVATPTGRCTTALIGTGAATKKASTVAGATALALSNTSNEAKKSINTGTSYLGLTATETAAPRQQTGKTTTLLRPTGAEAKVAIAAGTEVLALRTTSTSFKTSKDVGTATVAFRDIALPLKKSIDVGALTIALSASGTETVGVARAQTGTCAVPLRNSATDTKIAQSSGTNVLALRTAAIEAKISKTVGTAIVSLRDTSTALKKSINIGTAACALAAVGAVTSSVARAQTGTCALLIRATGTALKISSTIGTNVLPLRATSIASKISKDVGTSTVPLRSTANEAKTAKTVGTSTTILIANSQASSANVRQQTGTSQVSLRNVGNAAKKAPGVASTSILLRCTTDARKIAKPGASTAVVLGATASQQKKALLNGRLSVALTVTFTVQVIMANPNTVIRFGSNTTVIKTGLNETIISNIPGQTLIGQDNGATIIKQNQGQTLISL